MNQTVARLMSRDSIAEIGAPFLLFLAMTVDLGRSFGALLGLAIFALGMGGLYWSRRFEEQEQLNEAHEMLRQKLRDVEEAALLAESRRLAAQAAVQRFQSDR